MVGLLDILTDYLGIVLSLFFPLPTVSTLKVEFESFAAAAAAEIAFLKKKKSSGFCSPRRHLVFGVGGREGGKRGKAHSLVLSLPRPRVDNGQSTHVARWRAF